MRVPRRSDRDRPGAAADLRLADEGRLPRDLLVERCARSSSATRTRRSIATGSRDGSDRSRPSPARSSIREPGGRLRKRIAREVKRVGWWRFLDVLAFRAFHRLVQAAGDRRWERRELDRLRAPVSRSAATRRRSSSSSPNSREAAGVHRRAAARPRDRALQDAAQRAHLHDSARWARSSCIRASVPSTATRTAASGRWPPAIAATSA